MVEHLQSGDQIMASEDPSWQAMPHFYRIGCTQLPQTLADLFSSFKGIIQAIKYVKSHCDIHRNNEKLSVIRMVQSFLQTNPN